MSIVNYVKLPGNCCIGSIRILVFGLNSLYSVVPVDVNFTMGMKLIIMYETRSLTIFPSRASSMNSAQLLLGPRWIVSMSCLQFGSDLVEWRLTRG